MNWHIWDSFPYQNGKKNSGTGSKYPTKNTTIAMMLKRIWCDTSSHTKRCPDRADIVVYDQIWFLISDFFDNNSFERLFFIQFTFMPMIRSLFSFVCFFSISDFILKCLINKMSFGNRTTRTTNQPNQIKATRRASSNDLVDMIQTEKKVRNCAAVAACWLQFKWIQIFRPFGFVRCLSQFSRCIRRNNLAAS